MAFVKQPKKTENDFFLFFCKVRVQEAFVMVAENAASLVTLKTESSAQGWKVLQSTVSWETFKSQSSAPSWLAAPPANTAFGFHVRVNDQDGTTEGRYCDPINLPRNSINNPTLCKYYLHRCALFKYYFISLIDQDAVFGVHQTTTSAKTTKVNVTPTPKASTTTTKAGSNPTTTTTTETKQTLATIYDTFTPAPVDSCDIAAPTLGCPCFDLCVGECLDCVDLGTESRCARRSAPSVISAAVLFVHSFSLLSIATLFVNC